MELKEIVITGMGIISCIGKNLKEVTRSLKSGLSGIEFDEERANFRAQEVIRAGGAHRRQLGASAGIDELHDGGRIVEVPDLPILFAQFAAQDRHQASEQLALGLLGSFDA